MILRNHTGGSSGVVQIRQGKFDKDKKAIQIFILKADTEMPESFLILWSIIMITKIRKSILLFTKDLSIKLEI